MTRRLIGLAATLTVAALAAACDEAPPTSPAADGPSLVQTPSPYACLFSGSPSLPRAAATYFTLSADQRAASDLISQMEAGFTASSYAGAREKGFDLLRLIGLASRAGTGSSATDGAAAVQMAIRCMFNVAAGAVTNGNFEGWPTDGQFNAGQYDFATALTPSAGGVFYVRAGANDSNQAVVARTAGVNISGLAPAGTATWQATADKRVLVYGEPVTAGYDWKLIPRDTKFTPNAVVALCAGAQPGGYEEYEMVHQGSVGVLGFVGTQAASICSQTTATYALRRGPLGSLALLARLARVADQVLMPQPLYAAAFLKSSTIGGSLSGAKGDPFTSLPLSTVNLSFNSPGQQPSATIKVNTTFSVKVNVTTPAGEPAGGITVALGAITNNGTNTGIFEVDPNVTVVGTFVCDPSKPYIKTGPPSATTLGTVGIGGVKQPTVATWNNNLCFSKTGSLYITATSTADGRTGGIGTAKSNKVNSKP